MPHDGGTRRFEGDRPGDDRPRRVPPGRPADGRTHRMPGSPADGRTRAFQGGDPDAPTGYLGGPPPADGTRRLTEPGPAARGERLVAGRYRLEGPLGSGGMADVHRATDLNLDRPVAVKVFRPGADPAGEQRFREEARLTANLSHPGLVAVHDFGIEDHRPFLVMELVDGRTLHEVFDHEQLPLDEVTRIGAQVADALAYVHQQGVVHRDVKPSNILVTRNGRARLADFGISRMVDTARLTEGGGTLGTAAYMAPEQVRGARVGPPADIYALGLVLLEGCTGEVEYPGDGYETAAERLGRSPAVPEDLPRPLYRLLAAMTATDPADRPTATQCAAALREPLDEDEAVAPAEPERRSRGKALLVAAALVLIAVIVGAVLLGGDDEQQAAPPGSTPSAEQPVEGEPAPPPAEEPVAPPAEDGADGEVPAPDEGGGIGLPDAPDLPDLPGSSDLPDLPDTPDVPDGEQLEEDGRNVFERFRDWVGGWF